MPPVIPSNRVERRPTVRTARSQSEKLSQAILESAQTLARRSGKNYATAAALVSPNPAIPGNTHPNHTEIDSTRDKWKCNMFIGDVLFRAGFQAPSYPSGWYALSQEWPNSRDLYEKVSVKDARPGDLLIIDRGRFTDDVEGGGHGIVLASKIAANGDYDAIAVTGSGAIPHRRNMESDRFNSAAGAPVNKLTLFRPKVLRPGMLPGGYRLPTAVLRRGSDGSAVSQLQRILAKLNLVQQDDADGHFNPATERAVKTVQRRAGLHADGIYGPKTRAALRAQFLAA